VACTTTDAAVGVSAKRDLKRGQGLELAAASFEFHIGMSWGGVTSRGFMWATPRRNTVCSAGFEITLDSGNGFRDYIDSNSCNRNRKGSNFVPDPNEQIRLIRADCLQPFEFSRSRHLSWNCGRLQSIAIDLI
jgi:hypothetical protein